MSLDVLRNKRETIAHSHNRVSKLPLFQKIADLVRLESPKFTSNDGVQMDKALCIEVRLGRTIFAGFARSTTEGIDGSDVAIFRIRRPTVFGEVEENRKGFVKLVVLESDVDSPVIDVNAVFVLGRRILERDKLLERGVVDNPCLFLESVEL